MPPQPQEMVILLALEPTSQLTTKVQELARVESASPTTKFISCGELNPDTLHYNPKPDICVSSTSSWSKHEFKKVTNRGS